MDREYEMTLQRIERKIEALKKAQEAITEVKTELKEFGLDDDDQDGSLGSAHFGLEEAIGMLTATVEQLRESKI